MSSQISIFDNPLIVSKIASYLDFPSLKVCRSVCSLWKKEAARYFLDKAQAALLPSATDDKDKWAKKLGEYCRQNYGHHHLLINTDALSVAEFGYEEQMEAFVKEFGCQIKSIKLTVKLKTKEQFQFFLRFLTALESHRTLDEISICVSITIPNYTGDIFAPDGVSRFPQLKTVKKLSVSVPQGTFWPNINATPGFDCHQDFATKLMGIFSRIQFLQLGEDLQYISLNMYYLRAIYCCFPENGEIENEEEMDVDGEPDDDQFLKRMFRKIREIDILVTHSLALSFLSGIGVPLQRLRIRLGKEQNMAPEWDIIRERVEALLEKHKGTLVEVAIEQVGLSEWNIWQIALPPCEKLKRLEVNSRFSSPTEEPQPVEEANRKIKLQDILRMGAVALSDTLPSLSSISLLTNGYKQESFNRLLPLEGVASFPQFKEVNFNLPSDVVQHSLCIQRLLNIFPGASN